eukprot:scaffold83804_cov63-Phaeocystis_antarctica.AAC.5
MDLRPAGPGRLVRSYLEVPPAVSELGEGDWLPPSCCWMEHVIQRHFPNFSDIDIGSRHQHGEHAPILGLATHHGPRGLVEASTNVLAMCLQGGQGLVEDVAPIYFDLEVLKRQTTPAERLGKARDQLDPNRLRLHDMAVFVSGRAVGA